MTKTEIKGLKLGDYLESLKKTSTTSEEKRNMGVYPPHFYFFHQILTNSRIPKVIDALLWLMFGFMADIVIVLMPSHIQWFHSLYDNDEADSHVHLMAKVLTQQSAFAMIIFGMAILAFQAISFVKYKSDNQRCLSVLEASILSIIHFQLSPLMIIIYGIIFGCLLLVSIRDDLDLTSIFCALFTLFCAFTCFASSMYFQKTVRCSIVMYDGMFTFWKYPLTTFDHMYFFMSACFFPLVCGIHTRSLMGMAVIQIGYGIGIFAQMRLPFFISFFGNFVTYKLGLDAIGYGIMSVFDLWNNNIPTAPFLAFQVFYYFLTGCLSSLLLTVIFQREKEKVYNTTFQGYTAIASPEKALAHFRTGVLYGVPMVQHTEYLKWLLGYRFSELMIPDMVRFCIVAKIDMNELLLPLLAWSNNMMYSLKFLAFQLELQEKNLLGDESDVVKKIASEMEQEVARIKGLITVFWTENDVERRTLMDLGKEIKQVNEKFAFNAWIYAESKRIREIWAEYCASIMYDSKAAELKMKDRMRETILGRNSVYSWLNPSVQDTEEKENVINERMTDRLFRNMRAEWSDMYVWFWVILGVLIIVAAVGEDWCYLRDMTMWWESFVNTTYTTTLSSTLAGDMLVSVESRVILPSADYIARLLGITEAEANEIKRSKFVPDYNKSEAHGMLIHLNTEIEPEGKIGDCESVGLVSIVALGTPEGPKKDDAYRKCYYANLETYRSKLRQFALDLPQSFGNQTIPGFHVTLYVLVAVFVVYFIVAMVITAKERKKRTRFLKIVRIASARKPKMRVFEKLDISFSFFWQVIFCVASCGLFAILFVVYYYSAQETRKLVQKVAGQYTVLAQIGADCQYALAMGHMMTLAEDKQLLADVAFMQEVIGKVSLDIIDEIQLLINESITKSFTIIQPLDNWVSYESYSLSSRLLDFAFAIAVGETVRFNEESYDLLKARYIFYDIIQDLIHNIVPLLIRVPEMEVQEKVSFFMALVLLTIVFFWIIVYFQYVLRRRKDFWYSAALSVLMQEINADPYKFAKLISRSKKKVLCEIPLPIAIRDKQKRITYCNAKFAEIFKIARNQIIGQRFSHEDPVFEIDHRVFGMEVRDFGNDDMIILNDKTEADKVEREYQQLLNRFAPSISRQLPFKDTQRYFELLYDPTNVDMTQITKNFKDIEEIEYVTPISNGSSFLTALVSRDASASDILAFVTAVTKGIEKIARVALTEDTLAALFLNDLGFVVTCGPAVLRAHSCVLDGTPGCFYCDDRIIPLADDSPTSLENGLLLISISSPVQNRE